jgi:hypothetical protein
MVKWFEFKTLGIPAGHLLAIVFLRFGRAEKKADL